MVEIGEVEIDKTTIECCQCKKKAQVKAALLYGDWIFCNQVPAGWLVTDTYPPGDDGIRFACSVSCAQKYVEEHIH